MNFLDSIYVKQTYRLWVSPARFKERRILPFECGLTNIHNVHCVVGEKRPGREADYSPFN
jgi:hypothetical protein